MLAAFLAGIALGSVVPASKRLAWVDRLKTPLAWFGLVEVGIAATVTLLTPLLDRLPFVFLALFRLVGPRFWALQLGGTAVAFLVMLVPAALMGFAFPLVTRLATEHVGALGKRLSAVYAANTFGTVLGSFAAGFILIPAVGARHALAVGVALNALVGIAYLLPRVRQQRVLAGAGLGMAALSAVVWLVAPDWNRYALSAGAYLYAEHYAAGDADRIMREKELLYYNDALTATLSVTRVDLPQFGQPVVSLQINGKTDASTGDLSTQLMHGHLPALLHPNPRSAMMIGLASGCTLGAIERHPELQRADCVEIEPAMADITGFFRDWNRSCLEDPRAHLIINDARNFVLVSRAKYDVLTSEPSNPWIAGIANLFTVEHFRLCRERMAPGAIFCQWVPIYNLAPEDFRCIVATFHSVFPEASVWIFPDLPSDAYLIATLEPRRIDVANLVRRAAQPEVARDLQAAKLRDAWDLLGGYVFGPEVLARIGQSAALNTDDFPRLEFSSPLRLYTTSAQQTLRSVIEMGAESRIPLTDLEQGPDGYRSLLAGLQFGSPWRVTGETVCVYRSAEAYMARDRGQPARVLLRLDCGLGAGEADLTVGRLGELLDREGRALEPSEEPRRRQSIGGHEVLLWDGTPGAGHPTWTARWLCPAHERVYLVQARGSAPPPEQALAGLRCEH
jgi:spermidine synthase